MPRSQTQEVMDDQSGDSADEFNDDLQPSGSRAGAKGGRRRNATSGSSNRRDQNRIAQREFRQRKQQRTRELEMKVDLLSSSKEDAFKTLNGMVKDLMLENQALRQLVRDLSGFIGQGMGGVTSQIGWEPDRFQEFIGRGETDTAFKSYQLHKAANGQIPVTGSASKRSTLAGQKRASELEASSSRKRQRVDSVSQDHESNICPEIPEQTAALQLPFPFPPLPASVSQPPERPMLNSAGHSYVDTVRNDLDNNSLPTHEPSHPYMSTSQGHDISNPELVLSDGRVDSMLHRVASGYSSSTNNPSASNSNVYLSNIRDQPHGSMSSTNESPQLQHDGQQYSNEDQTDGYVDNMGRMIAYHLEAYRQDPSYELPACLAPTVIQRSIPHDPLINGIIFPQLRDKMILSAGSYNLADCMHLFLTGFTIHNRDHLNVEYVEVGEAWFRKFGYLADASILRITNNWRRERGEPDIDMSVLVRPSTP